MKLIQLTTAGAAVTAAAILVVRVQIVCAFQVRLTSTGSSLSPRFLAAAAGSDNNDPYNDFMTSDSGIRYAILQKGRDGPGSKPKKGQTVNAHYTGWLDDFDGKEQFDSTRDDGRLFQFEVGLGQVIKGWDESFGAMKIGERRQILLPPELAYGDKGVPGIIPSGATLYFDVELVEAL